MLDKRQFYVNGAWVDPANAKDFDVINPADETAYAVISLGSEADIDKAVAAAKAAFAGWRATPVAKRIALVEKLAAVYKARMGEMGAAISQEMGAPISLSNSAQAGAGYFHIKGFLAALKDYQWHEELPGEQEFIVREPIGVCGLITPWNWPMNQVTLKVVAAVAAGNTVVLKPSEIAPISSLLFAEMMDEAGFPKGVFNLVNGDGPVVGEAMSRHGDIDMMSFTGSTRAGIAVTKAAADTVKRVALELGGKSPNIVFEDADLAKAVKTGVLHCFNNTGQSCNAPTRMLVQRSVYDAAVEIAEQIAAKVAVGDPADEGRHIGPLVSQMQFDKVQELIQIGIDEGARLVCGGTGRPDGFNRGYFVRPTIFADVNNDMRIAREEVFGPVLAIIPFDTEEQAIAIANDTPYGLAAYFQTTDKERAKRVSRQLQAGMIRVNGSDFSAGSPFGGYKQSGNGREGGKFGIDDFVEVKAIVGCD